MFSKLLLLVLISTAYYSQAKAQPYQTGLIPLHVVDTQQERPLNGFIWYPTEETHGFKKHHENAVWVGIEAIPDAKPATGPFPLIVLSHGMFGNARNQSWLAVELAKQGFVVAAINHPGTSSRLRDPDDRRQLWERPKDITRAIDFFLAQPVLSEHIDPKRIFMAGHSLGGFTGVALAGGRYDHDKITDFCTEYPTDLVCNVIEQWNIAQTPRDRKDMEADLSDPRIKKFAIFDLGGTQTFSINSLNSINRDMLVIGAPINIGGEDLDIESRALAKALPKEYVRYAEPATLSHFDFLAECTPRAIDILKSEEPGEEVICISGGAERRIDHALISAMVIEFFAD